MATKTAFLLLVKPLYAEFQDTWDQPINENWDRIDAFAADTGTELVDSRFGKTSLKEFLEVAHETDGTLKPTAEVLEARSSLVYGDEDAGSNDLLLPDRLDLGDREVLLAREGQPSLRDGLALREDAPSKVIDGAKDGNENPTWMGFTGPIVQIDGSASQLQLMISGKVTRTRVLEQVNLTGELSSTYYIYAQFATDGVIRVDGDSGTPPPASPQGVTGSDGTKIRKFTDATTDFSAADVEVEDILEILGTNNNAKEYLIKEIAPGGDPNSLIISGVFPGGALASLDYVVRDQFSPTFGFDAAKAPAAGKLYIGEADFDGASVTAVRPLNFKTVYKSEWRAVDVSGGSPTFEEIFNHYLFDDALEVLVQASQANDGSQPVENLSLATLDNTLAVNISDGHVYNQGSFNPGTGDSTYTDGTLTGSVTGNLTGSIVPDRSVQVKMTATKLWVKNHVSAKFYRDYANAQKQTGFLRVVVRKRG